MNFVEKMFNINKFELLFLDGWKTPVVYLRNPQVYDLTNPTNLSKRKRQKTEDEDPNCIDLIDDDDNKDNLNDVITYIDTNIPYVMFSGFSMKEQEEQIQVYCNLNLFYFCNFKTILCYLDCTSSWWHNSY